MDECNMPTNEIFMKIILQSFLELSFFKSVKNQKRKIRTTKTSKN